MLHPRTLRFIGYFMRAYPGRTALLVTLLVLSGVAEGIGVLTILPVLELATSAAQPATGAGRVIESVVQSLGLPATLEVYLLLVVAGIFLKAAFLLLAMKQVGYTVSRVGNDLRLSLIRSLLRSRWGYFSNERAGAFANAVGVEAHQAGLGYRHACAGIAAVIQILVYLAAALLVSWKVALLGLASGGVAVALLGRLVSQTRDSARERTRLLKDLASRITDALQGMKALKAAARERHLEPVLASEVEEINAAQQRVVSSSETVRAAQEPLLAVMMVVLLYGSVVLGGQPFSAVLMIGFIFYRLAAYIGLTQTYYQLVTSEESAFWSLRDSMQEAEAAREPLRAGGARPGLQHELRFENVAFSYGAAPVLRELDLRIPAGAFVVLTGPSGAGKTTLIDLIVGLYEPDTGRITVDGIPLTDVDLMAWRGQIGYVPQEMFLFHDTVLHNVTLGDERVTREVAREALERAGAWDFVASLPEGLDTVVGERGTTLSGGERQRIAVARALARRPALLLLDEVTTSLDPDTERRLCANLDGLRGDTTVIAISHQPAVAELADTTFHFDRGTVHSMAEQVSG